MIWGCPNGWRGLTMPSRRSDSNTSFLGRHKTFHFRVWYRDALAGYVQEMLLDPRSLSRSYIERKGSRRWFVVTSQGIETTRTNSTSC